MARFPALCAATPIHKLPKSPKRRFTNVSFGLFHNLDQLLLKKAKVPLPIWGFGVRIILSQILNLYFWILSTAKS